MTREQRENVRSMVAQEVTQNTRRVKIGRPLADAPTLSLTRRAPCQNWYILYWWRGACYRKSTRTAVKSEAEKILQDFAKRWPEKNQTPKPKRKLKRGINQFTLRAPLLPTDEILRQKRLAIRCSGIYFLLRKNIIVYVGQAKNVLARIGSHAAWRDFDGWTWVPADPSELDGLERAYLNALVPEWNRDPLTCRNRKTSK